jgi:hypothetical protein
MNRLAALDGNGERVCSCLPVELRSSGPGPIARSAEGAILALSEMFADVLLKFSTWRNLPDMLVNLRNAVAPSFPGRL